MQKCLDCKHWVDATAECSRFELFDGEGWDIPIGMSDALAADQESQNNCEEYKD